MDLAKQKSKTQSKHRQVIPSKFPKSLRGAGDLVAVGEFSKVKKNSKITKKKVIKHHQVTSSPDLFGNSLEII